MFERRATLIAATIAIALCSRATRPDERVPTDASLTRVSAVAQKSLIAEHRYRIIGKVRFLLFWIGNDNVGGARVTWRNGENGRRAIALLIGSEPRRAPRRINEWGYIREEVQREDTDVFGIRSIADAKSLDEAEARLAQGTGPSLFGVVCSKVTATDDFASTSSVRVPADVTYHDFDRLLDAVSSSTHWLRHRAARPAGAQAGFLTALENLIDKSVENAQDGAGPNQEAPSAPYMYKGAVFDMRLSHSDRIAQLRIESEVFRDLIRGEFTIHKRTSGYTTRFAITYGRSGALARVPVQATYQPRWWLKLELVLDEHLAVPRDPGDSKATSDRIREICRKAAM
jgi:hypothetical protein